MNGASARKIVGLAIKLGAGFATVQHQPMVADIALLMAQVVPNLEHATSKVAQVSYFAILIHTFWAVNLSMAYSRKWHHVKLFLY